MTQILSQSIKAIQIITIQSNKAKLSSSVETWLELEEFCSYTSLVNTI